MIWQLFVTFAKIGVFAFGGGYAVIPLMQREVVTLHGWLSAGQMVDVIALSQMTPGPVAINLATLVGYHTAGLTGAVVATLGLIMPTAVAIAVLARFFLVLQERPPVQAVLAGIKPMVIALIFAAAVFIFANAASSAKGTIIALTVLLLSASSRWHPMALIILSGIIGIIIY
ncbi:MAG: chromate transporter [Thermoanaerobacteraceae bacterium]|nr:chromate transporter [Thermoanaerobacteraceae bacterium]